MTKPSSQEETLQGAKIANTVLFCTLESSGHFAK